MSLDYIVPEKTNKVSGFYLYGGRVFSLDRSRTRHDTVPLHDCNKEAYDYFDEHKDALLKNAQSLIAVPVYTYHRNSVLYFFYEDEEVLNTGL